MISENEVDRVINAQETHKQTIEKLKNIYKDDYQQKHQQKINKNLNHAIYIFESTPDEELIFLKQNKDKIKDDKYIERTIKEATDYIKIKKQLHHKRNILYYKYLCKILGLDEQQNMNNFNIIINLPIECFSNNSLNQIKDNKTKTFLKEMILLQQRKCLSIIKTLNPNKKSIDTGKLSELLHWKDRTNEHINIRLIDNTIWGKRIKKQITDKTKKNFLSVKLAAIIFNDYKGATYTDKTIYPYSVVYIPLVKQLVKTDVNNTYLHETRHIVELGEMGTGLCNGNNEYELINEINTQKNSNFDEAYYKNIFIDYNKQPIKDNYQVLGEYSGSLFEDCHNLINEAAVTNNKGLLENMFNKKDLKHFNSTLEERFNEIITLGDLYQITLPKIEEIPSVEILEKNYKMKIKERRNK